MLLNAAAIASEKEFIAEHLKNANAGIIGSGYNRLSEVGIGTFDMTFTGHYTRRIVEAGANSKEPGKKWLSYSAVMSAAKGTDKLAVPVTLDFDVLATLKANTTYKVRIEEQKDSSGELKTDASGNPYFRATLLL